MKYIISTALLTYMAFTSSCSCQLSAGGSADVIIDPQETINAVAKS